MTAHARERAFLRSEYYVKEQNPEPRKVLSSSKDGAKGDAQVARLLNGMLDLREAGLLGGKDIAQASAVVLNGYH